MKRHVSIEVMLRADLLVRTMPVVVGTTTGKGRGVDSRIVECRQGVRHIQDCIWNLERRMSLTMIGRWVICNGRAYQYCVHVLKMISRMYKGSREICNFRHEPREPKCRKSPYPVLVVGKHCRSWSRTRTTRSKRKSTIIVIVVLRSSSGTRAQGRDPRRGAYAFNVQDAATAPDPRQHYSSAGRPWYTVVVSTSQIARLSTSPMTITLRARTK
ncbi:hypothetical protein LXA43DRAFT_171370 [Ganoderma leucocontextum]|nr:hypothetical protein LXA43DRAFT_171370 [Ganoderma leucocontextum]